jgi:pimeloyl-ACP methyl ester carboxylesterase
VPENEAMQLAYETYGEGYPLLILHGLFGSSENWQTLSKQFARCYHVIALDLRNHGHSPHTNVFNYAVMAEDLREFMQAHSISSAYVLGHSMGGKVAMQFALTWPERVAKLVVVDIAPRASPPDLEYIFQALLSLDLRIFRTRKEIDHALAKRIPDESLRGFLLKNVTRNKDGKFEWEIDLRAIHDNYPEINRGIEARTGFDKPVLFIRGERSDYVTERDTGMIHRLFPYSKIVTVPGVGHWVHAEARRRFARIVVAFLGQA